MKIRELYSKKEFFLAPNILCYIRIVLVPVWVFFYFSQPESYWPLIIVILSGITDFFDGLIARKFNLVSEWGKLVDPLADKLTQIAVTVCLALKNPLFWLVVGLYVLKDGFLAIGGYALLHHNGKTLDGAKWYGKISTVLFYVIVGLLLFPPIKLTDAAFYTVIAVFALSVFFAMVMYVVKIATLWKK